MTTYHAISVAAGNIQAEAHDLCALGPALTSQRLREAVLAIRMEISRLEGLSVQLEGQEREPQVLVRYGIFSEGGWPK